MTITATANTIVLTDEPAIERIVFADETLDFTQYNTELTDVSNNISLTGAVPNGVFSPDYSYVWTLVSGTGTIINVNDSSPTVTITEHGVVELQVDVLSDDDVFTDTNSITVIDITPPVITLNPAQTQYNLTVNDNFTLPVATWTDNTNQTGTVTPVGTVDNTTVNLSTLIYTYTDTNGVAATPVAVTFNFVEKNIIPPAVTISNNLLVDGGDVVSLTSSATSDIGIASYLWKQLSGVGVTITNPTEKDASIVAPIRRTGSVLVFSLTVTDDDGVTTEKTVTVFVNAVANETPVLTLNSAIITALPNTNIILDGSSASDTDGTITSYQWVQVEGPTVTINNATSAIANFTTVDTNENNLYKFKLTATDNEGAVISDTLTINVNYVENTLPAIDIGSDITVESNTEITLDGSNSSDDGSIVFYEWLQLSGKPVTLTNANQAIATFTSLSSIEEETLKFRLTIRDNLGAINYADKTVIVNVDPNANPPLPSEEAIARTEFLLEPSFNFNAYSNRLNVEVVKFKPVIPHPDLTLVNGYLDLNNNDINKIEILISDTVLSSDNTEIAFNGDTLEFRAGVVKNIGRHEATFVIYAGNDTTKGVVIAGEGFPNSTPIVTIY